MSDPAHPMTLWLVRASMAACAVAILNPATAAESPRTPFLLWRLAWTMACVLLIAHVLAAFHFEHSWSHTAALQHTAEQTARVTGINWGGGLYFNYAFLLVWILDVALLWAIPLKRLALLRRTTDIACIFMVFNATAVFGPRWWIVPVVIVGILAVQFRRASATGSTDDIPTAEN